MCPSNSSPCMAVGTWGPLAPAWDLQLFLGPFAKTYPDQRSSYMILDLCVKFQLSSLIRSVSGTPFPWSPYLEDGVILDFIDYHYMSFLTCVPNFSFLAWSEVCQEPPILQVHTWIKVDGSWLDTWRMGSSLTSWTVMICDSSLINQIWAL